MPTTVAGSPVSLPEPEAHHETAPAVRSQGQSWHLTHPQRWLDELCSIDQRGWKRTITRTRNGDIGLIIHYPLREGSVRLRIRFGRLYPHFAPTIVDYDHGIRTARHRDPATGILCLTYAENWHPATTVADLIASQLPKLLTTASGEIAIASDLELATPEPVRAVLDYRSAPIIVTDAEVPSGVEQGALLCRLALTGSRIHVGVMQHILGPGFSITSDLPEDRLDPFPVVIAGRWIRDPEYRVGETALSAWRRNATRLWPLQVVDESALNGPMTDLTVADPEAQPTITSPDVVELIALLVPDETAYRTRGESWIFLLRTHTRAVPGRPARWKVRFRPTQYLSRPILAERTPVATALASKKVLIVGLGAIGMPIAIDLAHTGVGHLVVMDRDLVDVATGVRQDSSLLNAGTAKADLAYGLLTHANPYCKVTGVTGALESAWETSQDVWEQQVKKMVRDAVQDAHLVICATANPLVSNFLSQMRRGRPLLVVSGTAGGWGGVVALLTGHGPCWACLEHHRADRGLPIPPADPVDGWVAPTRCAELTFRGERASMQQIALHASTTAVRYLVGRPLVGGYFVAGMRDDKGEPSPISWSTTDVGIHPACPLHLEEA